MQRIMEYKIISGRVEEVRRVRMPYRQGERPARRGRKAKPSSERKIRANEQERVKNLARLINTNFGPGDLWLTLRYGDGRLPEDLEAAGHQAGLFIRRIAAEYKKQTGQKLRWIMTDGAVSSKTGEAVRPHHHLVLDGLAYALIIKHWPKEELSYVRLDGRRDYTGIARYMLQNTDNTPGKRRWRSCQGLDKPIYTEPVPVEDFDGIRAPKGAEVREHSLLISEETGCCSAYMRYIRPERKTGRRRCSKSGGE